ncbi:phage holin family protein [Lacinutrix neustonica]|uniref:Phage holin family protein n=1 Tax=Lacinutrix neustonica TaxID=2980107 RepID=A0A9E8MXA6_9FLAO|nr:phage holin family protein [Lacinutrix neustonica]WAC03263.1 phage holin family protein [Lacinutrix neustonica]
MSIFNSLNETSSHAVDTGEKLFKKSYEYYRLKIFQQVSVSISMVLKAILIGGLALIGLFFMAIALAFLIGALIANYAAGFVIVGGLFVLLSVILYLTRNMINKSVVQKLSKTFFK